MRIKGTSNISIIVARNEHAALHKQGRSWGGRGKEREGTAVGVKGAQQSVAINVSNRNS